MSTIYAPCEEDTLFILVATSMEEARAMLTEGPRALYDAPCNLVDHGVAPYHLPDGVYLFDDTEPPEEDEEPVEENAILLRSEAEPAEVDEVETLSRPRPDEVEVLTRPTT